MNLQQFLTAPLEKNSRSRVIFWLSLSLTSAAFYASLVLKQGLSSEFIIQDDARQHVFWMMRFTDSELFPNDLIADYFQSVAPAGYKLLYQFANLIGINPLLFHKLLPLPLGVISTYYCFGICLEMLPIPLAGFIAASLFNHGIWLTDDLASATPRAFAYPLFLGFLYYLLRGSLLPCLVAIALLGLFYPQYIFIATLILILRLVVWKEGKIQLSQERKPYLFCLSGLGVACFVLLPFAFSSSQFGPTYTASEAKQLPEFLPGGRNAFFRPNPIVYWLTGRRSGMFSASLFTPVTHCAGLLLPLLVSCRSIFPLVQQIQSGVWVLLQLFVAAVTMFLAAHATLFKLHLPSRYTSHSFRITLVFLAAIALTVIIDALLRLANRDRRIPIQLVSLGMTAIVALLVVFYPCFTQTFPLVGYRMGKMPELYTFFQNQPKTIKIASIAEEADQLPSFAQRSVIASREFSVPYQAGYYRQFRQRVSDLIQAQYSLDPGVVQNFMQQYDVDFWMLEKTSFTLKYVEKYDWLDQFEPTANAIASLQQGKIPILAKAVEPCTVFQNDRLFVLPASCIAKVLATP